MGSLLILIIVMGGMMFFMNRTQKKQQAQRQEMMDSMQPGSEVVTIGGLYGIVHEVNTDKNTVVIDCEGVYLEFERNAIKTVKAPAEVVTAEPVVEEKIEEVETIIVEEPVDK